MSELFDWAQGCRVLRHPLAEVALGELRRKETAAAEFRRALRQVTLVLGCAVLQELEVERERVMTPCGEAWAGRLVRSVVLVPVLRAGLGLAEGLLELLPDAEAGHIGLERDEMTHRPRAYYCKLPKNLAEKEVLVLDPMLATGQSAVAAVSFLKDAGARRMRFLGIVGCPEGARKFCQAHPDVPVYLAAMDEGLNDRCYIVPGLGDAGDRYFGTVPL